MSDHDSAAALRKAQKLVDTTIHNLSDSGKMAVITAVAADLVTTVDIPSDQERIAKLEAQTHVLSEAVIAITDQSATVAPAVKAVKDEM
jgi:cell division protein ZapA (FtsZ GTPase activity inhibitor)